MNYRKCTNLLRCSITMYYSTSCRIYWKYNQRLIHNTDGQIKATTDLLLLYFRVNYCVKQFLIKKSGI